MALFLTNLSSSLSLHQVDEILQEFGNISSYKFNQTKSEIIGINITTTERQKI